MSQLSQVYQETSIIKVINKQDRDGNTILHKECKFELGDIVQACQEEIYQKWPVKWGIHLKFGKMIVDALIAFYKETLHAPSDLKKTPFERGYFPFLTAEKVSQAVAEATYKKERYQLYLDDPEDEGPDDVVLDWPMHLEEEIADFLAIECRRWDFCGRNEQVPNPEIVSTFIRDGAKVSIKNHSGKSPIDLLLGI